MNINKTITALALACAFSFGAAGFANAQPPAPGFQGAQITPEQQRKAQQIFADNYAAMESTRMALAAKRAELDNQLASPAPDRGAIERLSREVGELRGKMLAARVALRDELEKNGLSTDLYAPDVPRRPSWDGRPEVWHHGYGHHRGHGWRGWGPCWNRGGWNGGCMY